MSHRRTTHQVFATSRSLRHNQTEAETRLWGYLRAHRLNGIHFRRQHAIGPYIVDFCAPGQKLIIELDGSQHLDQQYFDAERAAYLQSQGYQVLRFWSNQVMNDLQAVITRIQDMLGDNDDLH